MEESRALFSLQLAITDRCNLSCRHCYRGERAPEDAPIDRWVPVLRDFQTFCQGLGMSGVVSFTGGEPLLCPEVGVLIRLARILGMHARMATNGTLLTLEKARELKKWGLQLLQISLDGADQESHERIRGEGSFAPAIEGARNAVAAGIAVNFKATLIPGFNLDSIPDFFQLTNREKISMVSFARLIPIGNGAELGERITPAQQLAWLEEVAKQSQASPFAKADLHEPTCDRCFPGMAADIPYLCGIGESYLAIDSDGVVYPCRRMPVPIGNIFETSFASIWRHPLLDSIRKLTFAGPCGKCEILPVCKGGCRAAAYAENGDPLASDPACWVKRDL
ncbi:MAG TPA: radical SAM protein [Chroococcales cyanobacterium]|jgi:radical SAM protein with 4Fe4S-binding SPASM domain